MPQKRSLRLWFRFEGNHVELIRQEPVQIIVLPFAGGLPKEGRQGGAWVELLDRNGRCIFTQRAADDPFFRIVEQVVNGKMFATIAARDSGFFDIVIPDLTETHSVRLLSSRDRTNPGSSTAAKSIGQFELNRRQRAARIERPLADDFNGTISPKAEQILYHGPNSARWNLVILGEGYQAAELPKYHADIDIILSALQAKVPFNDLWPGINVFRVDVTSTDSFLDADVDNSKRTYYNSYFTDAGSGLVGFHMDEGRANEDGKRLVPEAHVVLVLVNFTAWTIGYAGAPVVACVQSPAITIHELGHMLDLADEYVRSGTGYAVGREPPYPNVTFDCRRNTCKWVDLINPLTPMPSACNDGSTVCEAPTDPIATPGIVGAFEGAYYYEYGSYRPTLECCMRWHEHPFCPVCERAVRKALMPFCPDPSVKISEYLIESPNVGTDYKNRIRLEGDFGIVFLYFVPEGETLGTNRKRPDRNVYDVYFTIAAWPQCVDLLRNEKPVYFSYNEANNTAIISTSDEPVGEAESDV